MDYLKKVWNVGSDIITWAWLDRLTVKYPRLARSLKAFLVSVVFGMFAWWYLDQRNVIYGKYSHQPSVGPGRAIVGGLMAIASLVSAYFVIAPIDQDTTPEVERPSSPPPGRRSDSRRARRSPTPEAAPAPPLGRRKKRRR